MSQYCLAKAIAPRFTVDLARRDERSRAALIGLGILDTDNAYVFSSQDELVETFLAVHESHARSVATANDY